MMIKEKEIIRTTIDLPIDLNKKLQAEAEKAKRSRHAQMLLILESSFEKVAKKEKSK